MNTITSWKTVKRIACFRPDNLGDVVLTSPAFRALKQSFPDATLTLITSRQGALVAPSIPEIDQVISLDVPWVKTDNPAEAASLFSAIDGLKQQAFDAAIIFTTFSQNPLPTAMIAYLAGIPLRLAYCRENPNYLLTDWVVDHEGLTSEIKHGVQRQLDLVKTIGATTDDDSLSLHVDQSLTSIVKRKLRAKGVDLSRPLFVLHPGASEPKRQFPPALFAEAAAELRSLYDAQIIVTGISSEIAITETVADAIATDAFSFAGEFSLQEFIVLLSMADLLLSNDTGPVHLASALHTPVVVLYANANREHTPWKTPSRVLFFDIPPELRSKNELLRFTRQPLANTDVTPSDIVRAAKELLRTCHSGLPGRRTGGSRIRINMVRDPGQARTSDSKKVVSPIKSGSLPGMTILP